MTISRAIAILIGPALVAVGVLIAVLAVNAGAIDMGGPDCPTEDSCTIDYINPDGEPDTGDEEWVIEEDTP